MSAPVQTSTCAVLSQVNNHIPSALSDLRYIRQDIREDFAELPEVFHGFSSASFERPDYGEKEQRSAGKEFQNTGTA